MRKLTSTELQHVYGGGGCYVPPDKCKPASNHYSQSKCASSGSQSCGSTSSSTSCAPPPRCAS